MSPTRQGQILRLPIPICSIFEIPHFSQQYEYDCGIACIQMVMQSRRSRKQLVENARNEGKSFWTIDLCYLLKVSSPNIRFKFCTKYVGANPAYSTHGYYDRNFSIDQQRVDARFSEAEKHGIKVLHCRLSIHKIYEHLAFHGLIILLIDANLLTCELCKPKKSVVSELCSILPTSSNAKRYSGHYIVLCGYSKGTIFYHDPAREKQLCAANHRIIDRARLAFGTDEDTILIYSNREHQVN